MVFRRFPEGGVPTEYPPFTSEINKNQIIINGYYLAPSAFRPEGVFDEDSKTITIVVQRNERDDSITYEATGYFYNVYISNLDKGPYNVNIIHRNDLMRNPDQEEHILLSKDFVIK